MRVCILTHSCQTRWRVLTRFSVVYLRTRGHAPGAGCRRLGLGVLEMVAAHPILMGVSPVLGYRRICAPVPKMSTPTTPEPANPIEEVWVCGEGKRFPCREGLLSSFNLTFPLLGRKGLQGTPRGGPPMSTTGVHSSCTIGLRTRNAVQCLP